MSVTPIRSGSTGALCVSDGHVFTQTVSARNITGYLAFLNVLDRTYPHGDLYLVARNLASHLSAPIRVWLANHLRIQHAFISVGVAWLNLFEGWWRLFRRKAFAGVTLANVRISSMPPASPRPTSTTMPTPGSRDALHRHTAPCAASSSTAFEERRTSLHFNQY